MLPVHGCVSFRERVQVHFEKWGVAGIAFAFNDGSGGWDNNGSPFKNYHAQQPGQVQTRETACLLMHVPDMQSRKNNRCFHEPCFLRPSLHLSSHLNMIWVSHSSWPNAFIFNTSQC